MVSRGRGAGDGTKGAGWKREVGGKAKGRFLLRETAPAFRFSKIWFGFQITADVTSKLFGTYGQARVSRTPSFPRCKSFPVPSRCSQLPECCVRLVSDSLASLFFVPLRGFVSDSLAGFFSGPSSKSRLRFPCEFLCRSSGSSFFGPCGLRFRHSDVSFLLSSAGGFLLR